MKSQRNFDFSFYDDDSLKRAEASISNEIKRRGAKPARIPELKRGANFIDLDSNSLRGQISDKDSTIGFCNDGTIVLAGKIADEFRRKYANH